MPDLTEQTQDSKLKMEISQKKVKGAINALRLLNKKFVEEDMKKQPLLEDTAESPVFLQVALKKIPPPRLLKMIRVPLPHSLMTETSEVCLFTGDLDKRNHKAEIEPTVLHYKDLLRKHGVTKVSQVIPLRQLRTEYKTFESKRQLAAAYDVFLVDKKIAGVMGKTLGKSFFQSRKFPIQIDMRRPNLKDQIDKALCQAEFSLTCRGNSYALAVARLSMEDKAIIENVKCCIEVLEKRIPGKKENILSLYIKTPRSKAVPIYVSLDIPDNILIKKPRKNEKCKIDELSTVDNAEVKVFRDGKVILRKIKKKSSNPEDENEEPFSDDYLMESEEDTGECISNEGYLKKRKKNKKASDVIKSTNNSEMENEEDTQDSAKTSRKKNKSKKSTDLVPVIENEEDNQDSNAYIISPKKNKKGKKSNVDVTTDIVERENEEIQDSVSAEISTKKKKKGRKSILDQVSDKAEMKSEEETLNSSYVEAVEDSKKDKKRKVSESECSDEINKSMKRKKEKKAKDANAAERESSFMSTKNDENILNVKTPLSSKKNRKKMKKSTEDVASSDSFMAAGEKANVDGDADLVKLNKRRKSDRKSISVV